MKRKWPNAYLVILLLLTAGYIAVEWNRPRPVDWSPSFRNTDKIPYGTYALYSLLEDAFPGKAVRTVRDPAYNLLGDTAVRGNYIFIGPQFDADSLDVVQLLEFAKKGNHVFIAARDYGQAFRDTLGFEVGTVFASQDSLMRFTNPELGDAGYRLELEPPYSYFSEADTLATVQLSSGESGMVNFIRVRFGRGCFYLHAQPELFSNYYLLRNGGHRYVFNALSHLPVAPVWWDEYYKQGRNGSVLGVIARYEPLRWAWYLCLGGLILFVIFGGRRRQRIIPVAEPLRNTSLEFAEVVSSLYYHQQDFRDVAMKRIIYLKEYIRNRYHEETESMDGNDEAFLQRMAAKTGMAAAVLKRLFEAFRQVESAREVSEHELQQINGLIEDFYEKAEHATFAAGPI